jgi:hypothetical protein
LLSFDESRVTRTTREDGPHLGKRDRPTVDFVAAVFMFSRFPPPFSSISRPLDALDWMEFKRKEGYACQFGAQRLALRKEFFRWESLIRAAANHPPGGLDLCV